MHGAGRIGRRLPVVHSAASGASHCFLLPWQRTIHPPDTKVHGNAGWCFHLKREIILKISKFSSFFHSNTNKFMCEIASQVAGFTTIFFHFLE